MQKNVVSMSGGKDSTALMLLALETGSPGLHFVFADTCHEHPQTYDYLDYLRQRLGVTIDAVRADFTKQIEVKRENLEALWLRDGVPDSRIKEALELLQPTGIPFLDLCLWKGRFPSTRARFCSQELKHVPLDRYIHGLIMGGSGCVVSWQGVRRDESLARADLREKDVEFGQWLPAPSGHLIYRPILDWTAEDVFAFHRKHGIKPNPLYSQGMGRVGCMPCIHARKDELRQIAARFPEELARVAEWERLVSAVSKRGAPTFMDIRPVLRMRGEVWDQIEAVDLDAHGIQGAVKWAQTRHGGLVAAPEEDIPVCSSLYGLCE